MKLALLGANRGMGWEVAQVAAKSEETNSLLACSRKLQNLENLKIQNGELQIHSMDFSKENQWPELQEKIESFQPDRIWYFAGGGPYGKYSDKNWKDHLWAWQVSFLTPARLLHNFLNPHWSFCQQLVLIGSTVAEDKPDPNAASYCAAKHALKGLVTTVLKEGHSKDIRLFSPSYMDTELLPPNAHPRQSGTKIDSPQQVAEVFWSWALNSDGEKHFRYT